MQDRPWDLPQDVLQLLATGTWCLVSAPTKLISTILLSSHALTDEDMLEKLDKFDVVV
jgi:hypothetical protein